MKQICPLIGKKCIEGRCISFRPKGSYEAGDTDDYCMAMRCSIEKVKVSPNRRADE